MKILIFALLILLSVASATVDLKIDLEGSGVMVSDSDAIMGSTMAMANGEMSFGQSISTKTGAYSGFLGLDASSGRFAIKTPEYRLDFNATDIYATSDTRYKVEEESTEDGNVTKKGSSVVVDANGNGTLSEKIFVGSMAHKISDIRVDGNLTLNRTASFTGNDVREKMGVL